MCKAKIRCTHLKKNVGKSINQGINYERNGRIIARAQTDSELWSHHPHKNSAGVTVSFSSDDDAAFGVGALKNNVDLCAAAKEAIKPVIKKHLAYVVKIANEGSKKNTTKEAEAIIEKEDNQFMKTLDTYGTSIGLPKREIKEIGGKNTRKPKTNKTGAVTPKGTTRRTTGPCYRHLVPEVIYVGEAGDDRQFWSVYDKGELQLCINTSNDYVQKFYVQGTPEAREALRTEWMGQVLADNDYEGSEEYATVKAYQEKKQDFVDKISSFVIVK